MCRHLLPRIDLHLGPAVHKGADWIGLHPVLAASALAASACAALGAAAYPGLRRRLAARVSRLAPRPRLGGWRVVPALARIPHRG